MFVLNPILKILSFGGVLQTQSLPPLIQVNCCKYLYQWNTGNGTMHILFWYERTTNRDVTECEWGKTKSAPALQRRLAYVWLDQTKWSHNTVLATGLNQFCSLRGWVKKIVFGQINEKKKNWISIKLPWNLSRWKWFPHREFDQISGKKWKNK